MTDAEIIRHLAEKVMGWKVFQSGRGSWWARDKEGTLEERDIMIESLHQWDEMPAWNPLVYISDAFEVQSALPEELRAIYQRALDVEVSPEDLRRTAIQQEWALITATPRQRCLAMVEATR